MPHHEYGQAIPAQLTERPQAAYKNEVQVIGGKILINSGPSQYGSHRIEVFDFCPQLYAYEYILGLEPDRDRVRVELVLGSGVHIGLAHYYVQKGSRQREGVFYGGIRHHDPDAFHNPMEAISVACAEMSQVGDSIRERALWLELEAKMQELTRIYMTWAASNDRGFKILSVEEEVQVTLQGIRYSARKDLDVEASNGAVFTVDHKTMAAPLTANKVYNDSRQVIGLFRFGRGKYKARFGGVMINAIGKESPFVIRRVPMPIREFFMRRFPDWVIDNGKAIQRLLDEKRDPWSWPIRKTCYDRWGKPCAAYDICHSGSGKYGVASAPSTALL